MPRGGQELKFYSPLNQALASVERARSNPGSIQVLCFPRAEWIDDFQPLIECLIEPGAEGTSPIDVCIWSPWEHSPYSPIASSVNQRRERLRTLSALHHRRKSMIILSSAETWKLPTIPYDEYAESILNFSAGEEPGSRDFLKRKLKSLGYLPSDLVEEPGQFALRGEILDIFDPGRRLPNRIEFFDTVVESIRTFHPETQRTLRNNAVINTLSIHPAEEILFPWDQTEAVLEKIKTYADQEQISRKIRDPIFENVRNGILPEHHRYWFPFTYRTMATLENHLPKDAIRILFEPEQFSAEFERFISGMEKDKAKYPSPYWITPNLERLFPDASSKSISTLNHADLIVRTSPDSPLVASPLIAEQIHPDQINPSKIRAWLEEGFLVWIGCRGLSHQERIRFLLKNESKSPGFRILSHDCGESLIFPAQKLLVLSETLLFGSNRLARPAPSGAHPRFDTKGDGLEFRHHEDLSVGDLVVHAVHGVGRYVGLQEIRSGDKHLGEYLLLEYAGGDKLYVPIYRLNTIQRYITSGESGSLDKLGTGQFEKAKQKARESARKLAINLVDIYARRAFMKGPKFLPRDELYDEFCDSFEFTETEGQLRATQEVLSDLESGRLLDRLVCGDVGFGKTEVAIRAAFQAVQSGLQVAVLVPTTLLAFQHEQSFRRRMESHPIRTESLSRFKSKKQQSELLKDLHSGKIDIMVGTHRLLSKDVEWSRLGLLIVDEEHRFGVEHKEKIKAIQANTHTLTLSATPIPRTLNMALSGLKDISTIKTPPTNRQPIKTYVSNYSPEIVKSAIEAELSRGGQVFYLYNRVQSIHAKAEEIRKWIPHAKVLVAHGQMSETEIEEKMLEFYQGRAQVLVCTTIIESGIDVPNAGTILIHRADQLGLAQLYQIRGRVGRSHRKAFAYLLVEEDQSLSREAKMRLDVLQRFVELGSGFQIASFDLEIRGGGNLLGGEQSGHIATVGLDLFTKLLEEAISELRGDSKTIEQQSFEPEIQVPVVCEINPKTVPDSRTRLTLYRKISSARNSEQIDSFTEEFMDRFGEIPPETENLFWLIRIKNLLILAEIEALSITPAKTSLTVRKSSPVEINEVMKKVAGPKGHRDPRIQITPDSKIILQIPFENLKSHIFELENFLRQVAPKAFEKQNAH
ncbi:MAG: transcription-repair coupling factor [Bdellovibrionales bacterium]|nr:transcription-repair coupling factor [Bdellovibrionales bacterium]